MKKEYLNTNQKLWDDKTEVHLNSEFYNVEAFKNGKNSLNTIELGLLGNVKEQSVLHLQCHFGLDSMSLSRLGAKVTAVDFSEKAIQAANELKTELNLDTTFIHSDVYKLKDILSEKFDIVYTSYGVLGWLPDMQQWAEVVKHFLKPEGKLVLIEFHPVMWMYDSDFNKITYAYSSAEPIVEIIEGTYTDQNADIANTSISWNHGLAKVFQALLSQNLEIKDLQEYDFSPYNCFQNTKEISQNKYQIKGLENKIPMVYSLVARQR